MTQGRQLPFFILFCDFTSNAAVIVDLSEAVKETIRGIYVGVVYIYIYGYGLILKKFLI